MRVTDIFVLQAGTECAKANPNLKCIIPDYCYISYLNGEYKEKDIKDMHKQLKNLETKLTKLNL